MELLHQQGEEEEEHQLQEVAVVAGELHQLALGVEGEGELRGLCRAEGEAGGCSKMGVVVAAVVVHCPPMGVAVEELEVLCLREGEGEGAQKDLGLMKGAAAAVVVEGAPHWLQVEEA